jgi:hypothetical protein
MDHADAAALQRPQQVAQPPSSYDTAIHRNPFLFRTDQILFKIPSFLTSSKNHRPEDSSSTDVRPEAIPLGAMAPDQSR